jgi:CheY-like chemotaxis protein
MSAMTFKHLLFLDDDPEFLATLEAMIPLCTDGRWRPFFVQNTAQALAVLRQEPISLVVSDLRMPLMDGVQFLRLLHEVCPHPRKVILSNETDETRRQACLDRGAVLVLPKPSSIEGFEPILRVFDEMMEWQPGGGFTGLVQRVHLSDIIQLECLSHASSILQISTGAHRGCIYIHEGRIVHAETSDACGTEAFIELVNLTTGQFVVQGFQEPTAETIHESCDGLLLAAAQRWDEQSPSGRPDNSQIGDRPPAEPLPLSDTGLRRRVQGWTSTVMTTAC